eukprot:5311508-Pyramimonas_sp.AAC.1
MNSRNQSSETPPMMLAPDPRLLPGHPGDPVPEDGVDWRPSEAVLQVKCVPIRNSNRPLPDQCPDLHRGQPEHIMHHIQVISHAALVNEVPAQPSKSQEGNRGQRH